MGLIRLGILGSTRGSNLDAIVKAIDKKHLPASIEIVISNKLDGLILERAASFGLKTMFINPSNLPREEFDNQLSVMLRKHRIDLIVLIGYMRILSNSFIEHWRGKIINIHPSLLPAFAGLMDLNVHQAVLEAGEKISGCTVHFVTEDLDAGPIILQKKCPVFSDDSAESLKLRVQKLEGEALITAIQTLARSAEKIAICEE